MDDCGAGCVWRDVCAIWGERWILEVSARTSCWTVAECCVWIVSDAGTVGGVDVSDYFDSPSHGANATYYPSGMDFRELGAVYLRSPDALDPRIFP